MPAAAPQARAPARARAHRRDPGAVRALDVHRAVVAPGRLRARRAHACARAGQRRPGHAAAGDDPPGLARGLLADGQRDPRGPAGELGALPARPRDGRRRRSVPRPRLRRRLEAGASDRRTLIEGMDATRFNGAQLWLDILRIPPGGTWERRRADVYALAEERLGAPPAIDPGAAAELLVRRYLQGFGPGAPKEIADWAGLPPRQVSELLEGMELRRFRDRGRRAAGRPAAPGPARRRQPGPAALPARPGTRRCSPMPGARRSCPRSTAPRSSASRRRSRPRPSRSTVRWPAPGSGRRTG